MNVLNLYNYSCIDLCYEKLKSELLPLCSLNNYFFYYVIFLFITSFLFLFLENDIKKFANKRNYNFDSERFLKTMTFLNGVISLIFIVASVKFSIGIS
ncbi:MAG: hypothetical protein ACP6IY_18875 [Promethearchaeia archaeon]